MTAIAIVNQKGGVGKTTTAVNLAHGLSIKLGNNGGGRVLLIDVDPQGNCVTALGISTGGRCLSQLLTGARSLRDSIIPDTNREEGGTGRQGLFLIPASEQMVNATEELLIKDFQSYRRRQTDTSINEVLTHRLGNIKQHFDFVIIDCPPSLGSLTEAIYDFADKAIVPVKPALLDATGAAQHTRMINELQATGLDITVSLILPTFYDSRQVLAKKVIKGLADRYGKARIATPIPQSVLVQQSQASGGLTLFEYAPATNSSPQKAYSKLVERVYNER